MPPRYTVPASAYVKAEARMRLWRYWWLVAVPSLVLAVVGAYDSRYWYLLLMLLFIVYPMAMSFAWMVLAAHKSMQWRLRPQEVENGDDCLMVRFYPYDDAEADAIDVFVIPDDCLFTAERQSDYLRVALPQPNKLDMTFLLIPADRVPAGAIPDNIV